jgi:GTP-binding protein
VKFLESKFECSIYTKKDLFPSLLPEVVFSGRSNVGKSSLINKLLNKKLLARTSSTPGKTIGINFYKVNNKIFFVDLPGYGYAKISYAEKRRLSELVDFYFKSRRKFSLILQIIDIRFPPTQSDLQMINFLKVSNLHFLIIMSKSDKLSKSQYKEKVQNICKETYINEIEKIPFSSLTGHNILNIKKIIASQFKH